MTQNDLVDLFKIIKFTRGKKEERLNHLKNIQNSYSNSHLYNKSYEAAKAYELFCKTEAVINDRSTYKSLDNTLKVGILYMFLLCDFGDSISFSESDYYMILDKLKYIKYDLKIDTSDMLKILNNCNRIRSLPHPNF